MVTCGDQVLDGLDRPIVVDQPVGGAPVLPLSPWRIRSPLLVHQQLRQQRVEAVGVVLILDGQDEELVRRQTLQHVGTVDAVGDRIADSGLEKAQRGCGEEEVATIDRLAIEYLLEQELGDRGVAADEPPQQCVGVGAVTNRECAQPDACDPTLGSLLQLRRNPRIRLTGHRRQEVHRVVQAECEITRSDLGHVATRSLTRERHGGVAPADDHEMQCRGQAAEHPAHEFPLIGFDEMGVVDDEHDGRRRREGRRRVRR